MTSHMQTVNIELLDSFVTIDKKLLGKSILLSNMFEESFDDQNSFKLPITFMVFEKISEYLGFYRDKGDKDSVFDIEFTDSLIRDKLLVSVIIASDFLDIPDIFELTCEKAGSLVFGKQPNQIQEILGISNEIFESELELMQKEWMYCKNQGIP